MKKLLPFLLASTFTLAAQEQTIPSSTKDQKKVTVQYIEDLNNLSDEQKKEYQEIYQRCSQLFGQRRIFECLAALHEIQQIYDGNPSTMNLEGACYVEFRSFDKARLAFERAQKVQPENFNVRFNLAEIEFVTQNWNKALKLLKDLEAESAKDVTLASMHALVRFKMILCMLKTDNVDGAKVILDETNFLDDSPLYYYGHAAMKYYEGKGPEAEAWLARAGRIFRDTAAIAPWQDTLIEFGYIESFYGGDLEVESGPPVATPE